MRAFCNAGKCRITFFRLSICITREEAARAELASRVSLEASWVVVSMMGLGRFDANTDGAYELVKVYFTELLQSVLDLRKSVF